MGNKCNLQINHPSNVLSSRTAEPKKNLKAHLCYTIFPFFSQL